MSTVRREYSHVLTTATALLVVFLFVIGLPLVGLAALVLRTGVLVAFGLALVGGITAYAVSPSFRDWFGAQFEPEIAHKGLRLGTDVAVHPGHTWARVRRREAVVGADDVVQATLGPVDHIVFPRTGTRIPRGQPLFCLRQGDRTVKLLAPVSGTVLGHNTSLHQRPDLVNQDPYHRGWVVRLRGDDVRRERRRLLRGERAREWFCGEVDRLIGVLLGDERLRVLADGGALMDELYRHLDDDTWNRLKRTFFEVAEL